MAVDKLAILINANGSQAISEFKKVGAAAGSELGRAEGKAAAFGATATKVGLGMMAAGGIIAAGLAKAGSATQNYALSVGKLQRLTGGSARDMSTLAHAAQQTGVDMDVLAKSIGIASKNIVGGKWDKLGIDTKNAAGEIRPMTDLMGDLAEKVQGTSNEVERNNLVLQALGRGGDALMPMLMQGREGFALWAAEVEKFGLVMDASGIAKAKELKAAQRDQEAAWNGLTATLGQSVMPIMKSLTNVSTGLAVGLKGVNDATGGGATKVAAYASAALLAAGALSTTVGVGTKFATTLKSISMSGTLYTGALVGVGVALAIYAQEQKKASDAADEMNEKLRKSLAAKDAAGTVEQLGRVREQIQGLNDDLAGSSNWAIWDKDFRDQTADARDKLAKTALAAEYALMVDMKAAAQKGITLEAYRAEKKAIEDAAKAEADGVAPAEDLAEAHKSVGERYDDARSAMTKYFDELNGNLDAESEYVDTSVKLKQQLAEKGTGFNWLKGQIDLNTEAGRENLKMSRDWVDDAAAFALAEFKRTGSLDAGRAKLEEVRQSFINTQVAAGMSREGAEKYATQLGLVPRDIVTNWQANGLSELELQLQRVRDMWSAMSGNPLAGIDVSGWGTGQAATGSTQRPGSAISGAAAQARTVDNGQPFVIHMDGEPIARGIARREAAYS